MSHEYFYVFIQAMSVQCFGVGLFLIVRPKILRLICCFALLVVYSSSALLPIYGDEVTRIEVFCLGTLVGFLFFTTLRRKSLLNVLRLDRREDRLLQLGGTRK